MKILLLAAALGLPVVGCAAQNPPAAAPAASQGRAEACVDTVAGSPAMSVEVMRETERHYWPELEAREEYRLTMLTERLGAHMREGHLFPSSVDEFAGRIPEVPWLSTCDPWGHRVRLGRQEREFELRSAGKDGVFGTADDLVRTGLLPTPRGPGGQ
ncbi:MAG TPA: hypothetical protein VGO40_07290 [Longimicrobium sp.]|jgi:hypothetical protein|nr:hypothetical protein [Longimicrobium sp.]